MIYITKMIKYALLKMMPNINNFEMINRIEENYDLDNMLILIVGSLASDELKIQGGLPSDVLVFKKPVPFEELELLTRKNRRIA